MSNIFSHARIILIWLRLSHSSMSDAVVSGESERVIVQNIAKHECQFLKDLFLRQSAHFSISYSLILFQLSAGLSTQNAAAVPMGRRAYFVPTLLCVRLEPQLI